MSIGEEKANLCGGERQKEKDHEPQGRGIPKAWPHKDLVPGITQAWAHSCPMALWSTPQPLHLLGSWLDLVCGFENQIVPIEQD